MISFPLHRGGYHGAFSSQELLGLRPRLFWAGLPLSGGASRPCSSGRSGVAAYLMHLLRCGMAVGVICAGALPLNGPDTETVRSAG